jgi:hypothetical protein
LVFLAAEIPLAVRINTWTHSIPPGEFLINYSLILDQVQRGSKNTFGFNKQVQRYEINYTVAHSVFSYLIALAVQPLPGRLSEVGCKITGEDQRTISRGYEWSKYAISLTILAQ